MASGDTKTEALLNVLGNGGDASQYKGCCNTKSQSYILDAIDRIQNVEDEVEELKNNPDVVDIVDTYADLQAYDTQHLSDNDIIRVLADETHGGNSTYYKFNKSAGTWTFIGEISGGGGGIKDLTADDLDFPVGNPSGIALWNLDAGAYRNATDSDMYLSYSSSQWAQRKLVRAGDIFTVLSKRDYNGNIYTVSQVGLDSYGNADFVYANGSGLGGVLDVVSFNKVADNLTTGPSGLYVLDAHQGKVLNDRIGDLSTLTTTAKTSAVAAINEIAQGGGGGSPIHVLNANDYNWNLILQSATEPYDSIALWLLPTGLYYLDSPSGDVQAFTDINSVVSDDATVIAITNPQDPDGAAEIVYYAPNAADRAIVCELTNYSDGTPSSGAYESSLYVTPRYGIDSEYAPVYRCFDDPNVEGRIGSVGDLAIDATNFGLYVCDSRDDTDPTAPVCTWTLLAGNAPQP